MSATEHRIRGDLTVILTGADALAACIDPGAGRALADIRAAVSRIAAALDGQRTDDHATTESAMLPPATRVLCVDDDPDNLALLEIVLRGAGVASIDGASTGSGAMELLLAARFDAVIVDWHLRDTSGDALVARFRTADDRAAILVLTGDPDVRDAARTAGADDVVLKPVGIDELVDRLAAALRARGRKR